MHRLRQQLRVDSNNSTGPNKTNRAIESEIAEQDDCSGLTTIQVFKAVRSIPPLCENLKDFLF